jgi:light-regulated signal transduction histidine kinase (bacteriophytochrome)
LTIFTSNYQDIPDETEPNSLLFRIGHRMRSRLHEMCEFVQMDGADYRELPVNGGIDDLITLWKMRRKGPLPSPRSGRQARAQLRDDPVDLSELATDVRTDLEHGEPGRRVEVQIAPALSAQGDPRLLRLVLQNLIGNAWKFTRHAAAPRIEVGSESRAGQLVFFVRDNGAGFEMQYAKKLFSPFQRLHSVEEFPGTGIGLATVQRIVARHGGLVGAESKPGIGATFWFTLPLAAQGDAA